VPAGEETILPPVLPPVMSAVVPAPAVPAAAVPAPAVPAPAVPAPVAPEAPIRAAVIRTQAPPLAPVAEPEPAPAVAVAEPDPVAAVVAEPPAPGRAPLPAAKKPALGAPPAAEERTVRYRTLAHNDIALLDRLFIPEVPGIIAHFVMISSIACSEPGTGEDTSGYSDFLRRDIELLGRALVHSRMGKAPQYRIVQADLDRLALPWEVPQPQSFPPQRRLRRDLRKPEWTAIGGLTQPSGRDATLRTRIALLALAGATMEGVDRRIGDECESALAAYRSSVLAWLVPLCVASAGQEAFVIPSPPGTVDATGRRLIAALKSAVVS
jgi:hypothetical protein